MTVNRVVNKLKELQEDKIKVLSTGIRVIIPGISQFELQEMALEVETIKPPRFVDPETGREVENFNDPDYIERRTHENLKRGLRIMDSMLVGVILVDGMPEDNDWIDILKFKEKLGTIKLDGLDLDIKIEREYAYKKYVAFVDKDDLEILQGKVKAVEEAAKQADEIFQGDEARTADNGSTPEEGSEGSSPRDNV